MIDEPFAVKEYTIAIHRAKPRSHHRTDSGLCIHSDVSPCTPLLRLDWCRGLGWCSWRLRREELGGHFVDVIEPSHKIWVITQGLGKAVHWAVGGVALPLASSLVHTLRHVRANVHLDKRILDELWIFSIGKRQAVSRILGAALPKAR